MIKIIFLLSLLALLSCQSDDNTYSFSVLSIDGNRPLLAEKETACLELSENFFTMKLSVEGTNDFKQYTATHAGERYLIESCGIQSPEIVIQDANTTGQLVMQIQDDKHRECLKKSPVLKEKCN